MFTEPTSTHPRCARPAGHPLARLAALLVAPLALLAAAAGPARAQAQTDAGAQTSAGRWTFPLTGTYYDRATGELVDYAGLVQFSFRQTLTVSAGAYATAHYDCQDTYVSVRGVGQTSGAAYLLTGGDHDSFDAVLGQTYVETYTEHLNVVSRGAALNEDLTALFHVTVHPDGTITALINDLQDRPTG